MANAQTTIDLIFNGVDKTGAATQAALKNVQGFGDNIKTATQPIADFTAGALKVEAAILAAGAAMTLFAVKVAGDFDASFREIATLIDEPIEGLGNFRDAILEYANNSTQPLGQVTQALYSAISAGVDYSEAIDLVTTAEQLAVAGRGDLGDSTLVLVSSLNAYGESMEAAKRYSDALFTTVKLGQTTLPELSASLALVTGTAATAGVPFETLLAAIATLTSLGTPTTQAVTQINGVLSAFLKPSKEAADLAQQLGIDFSINAIQAKGLEVVLQEVTTATGGSSEQMAKLFGSQEALRAVFPLTGSAAQKLAENIAAMGNSTGATEAAFGKMSDSIGLSSQQVQNSITGLLVAIGTPLLDEFSAVADAIGAVFRAIGVSLNKGELDEVINFIEGRMRGLQTTLETVARNLPEALQGADLSGFTDGIDAISDAFGNIFEGIDLTSVDGLRGAIENVGAAFNYLSNYVAGVIDSFKPLANLLFDASDGFKDIDAESARSAGALGGFVLQLNLLAGPMTTVAASLLSLAAALKIGGSIAAVTSALGAVGAGGLIGSLSSLAAIGAAGGVGYGIGTLANELSELTTGNSLSTWATDALIGLGLLDDGAGDIVANLNNVDDGLAEIVVTAKRIGEVAGPDKLNDSLQEVTVTARMWGETASEATRRQEIAAASSEKWAQGLNYSAPLFDIMTGKVIGFAEATGGIDKAMGAAADATKAFNLEAEKLKSAEAIAVIEATSATMVARIEADAQKTVAAFESITASIQSTGDTLTSLYGLLGDEGISKFDKLDIKQQIKAEADAREAAFRLQEQLTQAQIKSLNAQADALRSGNPLITINGDGLAPHLEAMMFEVLKAIQVRVNADGYAMLLGAAA